MAECSTSNDGAEYFASANKAYFDQRAHQLADHGHGHELGRKNVAAMRKAWPELFDEENAVAMDYACGMGSVFLSSCFSSSSTHGPFDFVFQETSPSRSASL